MKKPILIVIALICVVAACQIDKAGFPVSTNNTTLDGTWYLKREISDAILNDTTVLTPDTLKKFTNSDFYAFNSDNTVKFATSANPVAVTGYYSLITATSGQTLTIGVAGSGAGTAYSVNKLTTDSLIIYNSVTAKSTSGSTVTSNTYYYSH